MITLTLAEIAARLGGEVRGDGSTPIKRVATLENAGQDAIAFLANPKYRKLLSQTRAVAVIVTADFAEQSPVPCIITPQPYLYFARLAQWLNPSPNPAPGLHPTASSESAIPSSVSVGSGAHIGLDVKLGANVTIGPGCIIGNGCEIGDDSILHAACTLYSRIRIGQRAIVHSGAVIGADGFGFAREQDGSWIKIPQTGGVWIGDDVEIGANTCIDRGAIEDTVIEDGVKLDNQIQIAHNVRIGAHTAIAGCTGIAGSTIIGKRCTIAGASNIIGHLVIADDVNILVASIIAKSIIRPGTYAGAVPSQAYDDWLKNYSHLRHLDNMADKIRRLEKRLAELEKSK
ncbi:MAG: UDP-3-O-(3-hydroxymyristoyl)glucosamine N-acyltransferase [Georgfuchsia sp.]